MRSLRQCLRVLREAWSTSRAQPVASLVSIFIVAGMCVTILLTTGRTVGAEDRVLASIDSVGTRSIVVRADADSGLDTTVLGRLNNIKGVESAMAFSSATDAENVAILDGTKVSVRLVWARSFKVLKVREPITLEGQNALASKSALRLLGIDGSSGGIVTSNGATYAVTGELSVPGYLRFLQPVVLVPQHQQALKSPQPVAVLVVVAASPRLVSAIVRATESILAVDDPSKVKFSTSESLATLRQLVQGQLGAFGSGLVAIVFSVSAVLVAAILYGLVMFRRRDFGRRRALGASRSLIVGLLLCQTAGLSLCGAIIGSAIAVAALLITGDPLPGVAFFLAIAMLATATAVVASIVPAVAAALRDPLQELRVP
jgi:putative ABC transport system permease protein